MRDPVQYECLPSSPWSDNVNHEISGSVLVAPLTGSQSHHAANISSCHHPAGFLKGQMDQGDQEPETFGHKVTKGRGKGRGRGARPSRGRKPSNASKSPYDKKENESDVELEFDPHELESKPDQPSSPSPEPPEVRKTSLTSECPSFSNNSLTKNVWRDRDVGWWNARDPSGWHKESAPSQQPALIMAPWGQSYRRKGAITSYWYVWRLLPPNLALWPHGKSIIHFDGPCI